MTSSSAAHGCSSTPSARDATRASGARRADGGAREPSRAKTRFALRVPPDRAPPRTLSPPRRRRPEDDEGAALAAGGPLAHQSRADFGALGGQAGLARVEAPVRVSQVADRILTGVDATGRPSARIELNLGDWAGVDVDLVAGARGLELNVFAATAAARRTIQAQLTDLANALAERGLRARKIEVTVRRRDKRGGTRQDDPR